MRRMNSSLIAIAGVALLVSSGCAGDEKKQETTTPKKLAQKQTPAPAEAPAPAKDTKLAKADPAPAPKPTPTPAPTPAPAPADDKGEPDVFAKRPPPKAEVKEALTLVRRGRYMDAIRKAKDALRKSEKYTPAMEVMARAYFKLGKQEFAEAICDTAIELNPNSGKCYNLKGFIELQRKDGPKAIKAFKKATEIEPDLGAAWLNLGAMYLKVKNYTAAEPVLEKAAQLLGSRAEAHLNLGAAYRGNKKDVKALASFQQALRLRANYPAALFNLGILYLDAEAFPGMKRMEQLAKAESYLQKYKGALPNVSKDDPVETYLQAVAKEVKNEQRRIRREKRKKEREARRKARDAAKAAAAPKKDAAKKDPAKKDAPKK